MPHVRVWCRKYAQRDELCWLILMKKTNKKARKKIRILLLIIGIFLILDGVLSFAYGDTECIVKITYFGQFIRIVRALVGVYFLIIAVKK